MTKEIKIKNGVMEHAIGLSVYPKFKKVRNKDIYRYKAYRNYYTSPKPCPEWEGYVKLGYAKRHDSLNGISGYCVTTKGIKYLEQKYNIIIKQDEEDVVEVANEQSNND